jgi:thiamine pyrophosphate-dependent acetolactate synthase large subunit-like protein
MAVTERNSREMPVIDALQVLINLRTTDQIVVTNQTSARIWPRLAPATGGLDFHYNPSTMGGAIPFALGLALAQPRHVLVVSGDGALLMSLGALVTVVGTGATNLTIVVLDNGMYEVTGGQKTPASETPTDFCGLARAAGFPSVAGFGQPNEWKSQAAMALARPGPRFISLKVQPTPKEYLAAPTPPIGEQLARLRQGLRGGAKAKKDGRCA